MASKEMHIDLNCDLGESTHEQPIPDQASLFPYLTSCNIACGFHAGDPIFITEAIRQALAHGLRIGAHPSYPDRANFGRRPMHLPTGRLQAGLRYQIAALKGMVESMGGQLSYVKPHGALYNQMANDKTVAEPVIEVIREIDPGLALMGLANSKLRYWANACGIRFIAEAFADRRYTANGQLAPRSMEGAVIDQPEDIVRQAHSIIAKGQLTSLEGQLIAIQADSLCLHGDHPRALEVAKALNGHFTKHGIQKRAV